MTMVNSTLPTTPTRPGVSLRKTNKPLMEKRRRARINDSLSQLKSLVIHSSKKDSSQFSKLEKADILELTVKHLRGLQAHHHHQQQQQLPLHQHPHGGQSAPTDSLVNGKYRAGFVECANEVIRYLDQSQGLNQDTKTKVVSHLANCLQIVSTANNQQQQQQQPKLAPQPPMVVPQQAVISPQSQNNNAAAIIAAAAAAAGNSTTTTTQLPNGQLIQIVSNPMHQTGVNPTSAILGLNPGNVHPAAASSCSNGSLQGMNFSTLQSSNQGMAIGGGRPLTLVQQPVSALKPAMNNQNKPSAEQQGNYINYAQPLHIQIPPIVSPVLLQKPKVVNKTVQSTEQATTLSSSSTSSSSSSSSSSHSSSPDQVHEVVSSSTSAAPASPRTTTTPPSLYPGHPKARAQKQLNFYNKSFDNTPSENASYSKPANLSMTPSSSSSSETENTSPLNLSQSPPFLHLKTKQRQPSSFNTNALSQKQSAYPYPPQQQKSALSELRAFRDGSNIGYGSRSSYNNNSSVIVDSRRCGELAEVKYVSLMEEERHCLRQRNTPSPASSVGEERLWRPW